MKNYIEYLNGRKEEIVFYREFKDAGMIFATSTDLYLASLNPKVPAGYDIYTLTMEPYPGDLLGCQFIEVIKQVVIDDEDTYNYDILNPEDNPVVTGSINVKRNTTDDELRKQITDMLRTVYSRNPYLR